MYHIHIQKAHACPKKSLLKHWASEALQTQIKSAEITIRIVDVKEMTYLNSTYRHKNKSTNVLSFPFSLPEEIKIKVPILGDIVLCAEVINDEARAQKKEINSHWAHMIIHGVFHLLGYDHEDEKEASIMENLEIKVMKQLGFDNPYH